MEFVPHTLGKQTKCYNSRVIPCKMNETIPPVTVSMQKIHSRYCYNSSSLPYNIYLQLSMLQPVKISLHHVQSIWGIVSILLSNKKYKKKCCFFFFFFFWNRGFCTYMAREQVKDFQSGSHSRELATALFVRRSIDRNAQLKVWNRN